MKFFKQILYGIFAALGLAVVVILTNQQVFNRVANELGGEAIENEDFEFFISSRYYHQTPLLEDTYTFGEYTFDIKIYNIANIIKIDDNYDVVEGYQIILHQISPIMIDLPFSAILTTEHPDIAVEVQGYQVGSLPVFVFMDIDSRSTMFAERLFYQDDVYYPPTQFEILHFGEIIGGYSLTLTKEDLQLKTILNAYIQTNQAVPKEAFDDVGYGVIITFDSTREVIRNGSIYVTIVFGGMYLLFIFKRKRLGRSQASDALKKDVERIKVKQEQER